MFPFHQIRHRNFFFLKKQGVKSKKEMMRNSLKNRLSNLAGMSAQRHHCSTNVKTAACLFKLAAAFCYWRKIKRLKKKKACVEAAVNESLRTNTLYVVSQVII